MRNTFIILLFVGTITASAQAPPGTEIYLFDLMLKKKNVSLSNPQNITNRPGYDNQPFFHPDKPLIYFSSADEEGRTDIKVYDYQKKTTTQFTATQNREYSPTVTPDKKFISCIIQTDSGQQNLGKYPIDGGNPELIITNLTVGYHAWVDADNLVLFVLGEPNTLRWYSVQDKKDFIVGEKIGRSLHKIPGTHSISYVDKSQPEWMIHSLAGKDVPSEMIFQTVNQKEDLAWAPEYKMFMSDGEQIMFWQPGLYEWVPVELPSEISLKGITRLAINSKGNKLAVVVSE